ncbi:MAG: response regulator [Candidatus Bipolaricaulia bacterium]
MIRILLADDHQLVRQGIGALLEGDPELEIVGEAQDGLEAVQLVERLRPDVAILDIAMPILGGLEATEKIHGVSPKTRVLLLSMFADEEYILKAARAGAAGYLLKEGLAEELGEAIQLVCKRSRFYLSRAITNEWLRRLIEGGRPPGELLTPREREVLELIARGFTNKEIAAELRLSVKTVETHRAKLMEKLDTHTAAGLIRYALTKGWIEP